MAQRGPGKADRMAEGVMSLNIHIVCQRITKDRILPRISRYLMNGLGWTGSDHPDPKAAVNYFVNYADGAKEWQRYRETLTAALFTHYPLGAEKQELWDLRAASVNLRVADSPRYHAMLLPAGPTLYCRPPVDLKLFTIMPYEDDPRERGGRPLIGTGGFVCGDGRKGEELAFRFFRDGKWDWVDMIASGEGWEPIFCEHRTWLDMPAFYQNLDCYLCTSLIEAGPAGPLEALACGVPVVVPADVGLMDELPEMTGIRHYQKGSYEDMTRALMQVLEEDVDLDREALRHAVEQFSMQNWCLDHAMGFETVLGGT